MLIAYRIVRAIDEGKMVRLSLTETGIEDPRAGIVLLDSKQITGFRHIRFGRRDRVFKGNKRPDVNVNGQMMRLVRLSYLRGGWTFGPAGITAQPYTAVKMGTPTVFYIVPTAEVIQGDDNITMLVAWE